MVYFCEKVKQVQVTIEARYGPPPLKEELHNGEPMEEEVPEHHLFDIYDNADDEEEDDDDDDDEKNGIIPNDMVKVEVAADKPSVAGTRKRKSALVTKLDEDDEEAEEDCDGVESGDDDNDDDYLPNLDEDYRVVEPVKSGRGQGPKKPHYNSKEVDEYLLGAGVLACAHCQLSDFKTFRLLKQHAKDVHDKSDCTQCCGRNFATRIMFYEHVVAHIQPKLFSCEVCAKEFQCRRTMANHMKETHSELKFPCDQCPVKYPSLNALRRHQMTHIPMENRVFACKLCDSRFNFRSQLNQHMALKHNNCKEPHVCEVCGKHFTTKANLKNHYTSFHDRSAVKPRCDQCGKFVRRMGRHLKICQQKLELKCPHCDNIHPNDHALKTHIARMHRADRAKLQCTICGKILSRDTHLRVRGINYGSDAGTPPINNGILIVRWQLNVNSLLHVVRQIVGLLFILLVLCVAFPGAHGHAFRRCTVQMPVLPAIL